jgi:DNA-binding MarR family transcriptional regulator
VYPSEFVACRQCVCSALRRASRAVTQHYEACFRGTGLRATQFTLLATLLQTGPLPMGALAERLGLERTSLTRNLNPLQRRDLVAIAGDEDQRVRRIAITAKGKAAALAGLPAWRRAQASVGPVLRRLNVQPLLRSPPAG